jgi:phospholipid/cholesterol/gamma-HCH transport system substrate-binding protein
MKPRIRSAAAAGILVAMTGGLSACGLTMGDLPIPGTGVNGDKIEVTADFRDALNLAQGALVKVNGVDAGKVTSIGEKDFTAEVAMDIQTKAELHQGATVRLRYTTPLGELFVDVTNPKTGPLLKDGASLDLSSTDTAPSVEDALSEASLLINGGGLDQLQTITNELNTALGGHEGDYRALLEKSRTFLTQANATTGSIDQVLSSLNAVSKTLNARKGTINAAMRDLRPAAKVLREETPAFTKLLKSMEQFSAAANGTVSATRAQLLRMLKELEPVLAEFAKNRGRFDQSLRALISAAGSLDEVVPNDYAALSLNLHIDSIDVGGLLPSLGSLFDLVGLGDVLGGTGLPLGSLGDVLTGVLGGSPLKGTKTTKGTKSSGGTTGSTAGLGSLLTNLLGGGR